MTQEQDRGNPQKLTTVRQASEILGISPHTLRAWIAMRKIGVVRLGRSVRVPQAEIDRLMDAGWIPPSREAA